MLKKHEDKKIIGDQYSLERSTGQSRDDTIMIGKHQAEPNFSCRYCLITYINKAHFHGHMDCYVDSQPHKCPKCENNFDYKSSLLRHSAGSAENCKHELSYAEQY